MSAWGHSRRSRGVRDGSGASAERETARWGPARRFGASGRDGFEHEQWSVSNVRAVTVAGHAIRYDGRHRRADRVRNHQGRTAMKTTEPRQASDIDHDIETLRDDELDAVVGGSFDLGNIVGSSCKSRSSDGVIVWRACRRGPTDGGSTVWAARPMLSWVGSTRPGPR